MRPSGSGNCIHLFYVFAFRKSLSVYLYSFKFVSTLHYITRRIFKMSFVFWSEYFVLLFVDDFEF